MLRRLPETDSRANGSLFQSGKDSKGMHTVDRPCADRPFPRQADRAPETVSEPSSCERGADGGEEVRVGLEGGQVGVGRLDRGRAAEEEAGLGGADHRQVVVAVAGGDRVEADGLQRAHGHELGLRHAHAVARDHAVRRHVERVAEERRAAELLHERRGELLERVAQEDHLRLGAERVEEVLRAGERVDAGDHLPDAAQAEAVLAQDAEPEAHELAVVGLVAGGAAQFGEADRVGERDPDFGDEDALDVEADDVHVGSVGLQRTATLHENARPFKRPGAARQPEPERRG